MGKWGLADREDRGVVMVRSSKRALVDVIAAQREEKLRVVRMRAGLYVVYAMMEVPGIGGEMVEVPSGPSWLIGTRAALEAWGRQWPRSLRSRSDKEDESR